MKLIGRRRARHAPGRRWFEEGVRPAPSFSSRAAPHGAVLLAIFAVSAALGTGEAPDASSAALRGSSPARPNNPVAIEVSASAQPEEFATAPPESAPAVSSSNDPAPAPSIAPVSASITPRAAAEPIAAPPLADPTAPLTLGHDPTPASATNPADASLESLPLGRPNGPLSARPAAESAASPATPLRSGTVMEALRVGGALAVVIAIIVVLRVLMRRAPGAIGGAGRPSGVLEVLARYPVGRGQSLVLLKLARRVILIHQSGSSASTLCEVSDPDEVAGLLSRLESGARASEGPRFRSMLRQFLADHAHADGAANGRRDAQAARVLSAPGAVEIVDLTRGAQGGRLEAIFGARRSRKAS